jgi:hypothetical protein
LLLRALGLISLLLGVLTVYFACIGEQFDATAVAAADHALVRALRVLAGACAIAGLMIGVFVLNRRDEAALRAPAARDGRHPSA